MGGWSTSTCSMLQAVGYPRPADPPNLWQGWLEVHGYEQAQTTRLHGYLQVDYSLETSATL
jgi:hypothetical protein